jgi:hypothetical protein
MTNQLSETDMTIRKTCSFEGCKKKLAITDFDCRCKKRFCGIHRCSASHNCTYDCKLTYIEKDKMIEQMKCVKSKIEIL